MHTHNIIHNYYYYRVVMEVAAHQIRSGRDQSVRLKRGGETIAPVAGK